jgi:hypothetical protein
LNPEEQSVLLEKQVTPFQNDPEGQSTKSLAHPTLFQTVPGGQ